SAVKATTCSTTRSSARSMRTRGLTLRSERRRIRCSASLPRRGCRGECNWRCELLSNVGQVGNLRPIVNRPRAGPWEQLWGRRHTGLHRIHLNVTSNPLELRLIANQPIIAFILPERLPRQPHHPVTLPRSESLERLHQLGNRHARSDQKMHVVGHDAITVEIVMAKM